MVMIEFGGPPFQRLLAAISGARPGGKGLTLISENFLTSTVSAGIEWEEYADEHGEVQADFHISFQAVECPADKCRKLRARIAEIQQSRSDRNYY